MFENKINNNTPIIITWILTGVNRLPGNFFDCPMSATIGGQRLSSDYRLLNDFRIVSDYSDCAESWELGATGGSSVGFGSLVFSVRESVGGGCPS